MFSDFTGGAVFSALVNGARIVGAKLSSIGLAKLALVEVIADVGEADAFSVGVHSGAIEDLVFVRTSGVACVIGWIITANLVEFITSSSSVILFDSVDGVLEGFEGEVGITSGNDEPRDETRLFTIVVEIEFITSVTKKKGDSDEDGGDQTIDDDEKQHEAIVDQRKPLSDMEEGEETVEEEEEDRNNTNDNTNSFCHIDVLFIVITDFVQAAAEILDGVFSRGEVGIINTINEGTIAEREIASNTLEGIFSKDGDSIDIIESTQVGSFGGVSTTENENHGSNASDEKNPRSEDGDLAATFIVTFLFGGFINFIPRRTAAEGTRATFVAPEASANVAADCDDRAAEEANDENQQGDDDTGTVCNADRISNEGDKVISISEA